MMLLACIHFWALIYAVLEGVQLFLKVRLPLGWPDTEGWEHLPKSHAKVLFRGLLCGTGCVPVEEYRLDDMCGL